jgi:hypothetical protein
MVPGEHWSGTWSGAAYVESLQTFRSWTGSPAPAPPARRCQQLYQSRGTPPAALVFPPPGRTVLLPRPGRRRKLQISKSRVGCHCHQQLERRELLATALRLGVRT